MRQFLRNAVSFLIVAVLFATLTAATDPVVAHDILPLDQAQDPVSVGQRIYNQAHSILTSLLPTPRAYKLQFEFKDTPAGQYLEDIRRKVSNWIDSATTTPAKPGDEPFEEQDLAEASKKSVNEFPDLDAEGQYDPVLESDAPSVKRGKAVKMLMIAAKVYDNSDAWMLLGEMHLMKRLGHPRNVNLAFEFFSALAHGKGNATAQRMVGLMYATGIGVQRDYVKALLYMSFAAMGHDTIAQQTLGYWHYQGIATTKSCDSAVWYYKQVADKAIDRFKSGPPGGLTLPRAKSRLSDSDGAKPASQGAVAQQNIREIFEVQADEGEPVVQLYLGNVYYSGTEHTPRDFNKAFRYYMQAAKAYTGTRPQGDVPPQVKERVRCAGSAAGMLGKMYWRGEGVKQDNDTARKWFERGEELDNPASLHQLGLMYLEGVAGLEKDVTKAFSYFTASANMDVPEAQVSAAEMTLRSGKPDAHAKAFQLYSLAANHVNPPIMAIYRLGEMTTQGLGTAASCYSGTGFLKSVAERGDWHDITLHRAQRFFEVGDYESSLLFYLFAAERGYEIAQANAAWIIDKGLYEFGRDATSSNSLTFDYGTAVFKSTGLFPPGTDPYEVALVLWNRAANQGNVEARVKIGDYHFHGLGLAVRKEKHKSKTDSADGASDSESAPAGGFNGAYVNWLYANAAQFLLSSLRLRKGASPQPPQYEKAALYYQVASDEHNSLAQWNMGWMYEYGVGVPKDYPLAKRMYDLSYATNSDGYLPVNLALANLFVKSSLSTIHKHTRYILSGNGVIALTRVLLAFIRGEPNVFSHYAPDAARKQIKHTKGAIPELPEDQRVDGLKDSKDWEELWMEVLFMTVLAGVIGVLFLWRQLIANEPAAQARRAAAAALAAARPPAPGASAPGVPAAAVAAMETPAAGDATTTPSVVAAESAGPAGQTQASTGGSRCSLWDGVVLDWEIVSKK
ncbi:hypothetical protein DFJ73DRAFT_905064 [Zopfochytrium polystomum]|nr:hypothetical protein DFJ73DRAFT_905064 [Zopfochytrium polystomum]